MKDFFNNATNFLVALGTVATACATIYSEYNKSKENVSSTTKCASPKGEKI